MDRIALPYSFKFTKRGTSDFQRPLALLDWTLQDEEVEIDLSHCIECNYQTLSLLVLYAWRLTRNRCIVRFNYQDTDGGAGYMWQQMGAPSLDRVLNNEDERFRSNPFKPLIAVRNANDLHYAAQVASDYTRGFNIEYEKTLRYVVQELLYNTLEHGKVSDIPSIIQFTWYKNKQSISFIIADVGIGIKSHLRQVYTHLGLDSEAIEYAMRPQVSGTFLDKNRYQASNNAGVGLFISSGILRELHADMYIVSGDGVVHVSPTDVTSRTIGVRWPGTFVYVTVRLGAGTDLSYERTIAELRKVAITEGALVRRNGGESEHYLGVRNLFGRYPEDKTAAARIRDAELLPAVVAQKVLIIDFDDVTSAPHSFLHALLASPIRSYGIAAYKQIKIINATPDIRATIDFIMDENTELPARQHSHAD